LKRGGEPADVKTAISRFSGNTSQGWGEVEDYKEQLINREEKKKPGKNRKTAKSSKKKKYKVE